MDKNDILNYVTETPGNTNRAVLGDMLDSFAGGGGDSNLSIAQVTLTIAEGKAELPVPVIFEQSGTAALICGILHEEGTSTMTVNMPLYKGMTVISISSLSGNVTTTGACEYTDDQLIITGDCAITIS